MLILVIWIVHHSPGKTRGLPAFLQRIAALFRSFEQSLLARREPAKMPHAQTSRFPGSASTAYNHAFIADAHLEFSPNVDERCNWWGLDMRTAGSTVHIQHASTIPRPRAYNWRFLATDLSSCRPPVLVRRRAVLVIPLPACALLQAILLMELAQRDGRQRVHGRVFYSPCAPPLMAEIADQLPPQPQ
ncbi:hypothetical protein C8R44DRAFT_885493 [Mycena epipterygia]|nr:hypothetical protein C8R44DRAFT_885493 [Mycena epipterygia]